VPKKRNKVGSLPVIELNAAGIDVGATEIFVAVPADRDPEPVRRFPTFTGDLERLADWLQQCQIRTAAMESTGVYWIPLFQILEKRTFEVRLVNAHPVKNVPGRKTDVQDCQWIQHLHSFRGVIARIISPGRGSVIATISFSWPPFISSPCRRRWTR
jgi:hypothetical protein